MRKILILLLFLPPFPRKDWTVFKLGSLYKLVPRSHVVEPVYTTRRGTDSLRITMNGQFVSKIDTVYDYPQTLPR